MAAAKQRDWYHVLELADGSGNEEKTPDVMLEWRR